VDGKEENGESGGPWKWAAREWRSVSGEVRVSHHTLPSVNCPVPVELLWDHRTTSVIAYILPHLSTAIGAHVQFYTPRFGVQSTYVRWDDVTFQFPPMAGTVSSAEEVSEEAVLTLHSLCDQGQCVACALTDQTKAFWQWLQSQEERCEGESAGARVHFVTALDAARFFFDNNFEITDLQYPPRFFQSLNELKTVRGNDPPSLWDTVSPLQLYSAHRALYRAHEYFTPIPRGGGFIVHTPAFAKQYMRDCPHPPIPLNDVMRPRLSYPQSFMKVVQDFSQRIYRAHFARLPPNPPMDTTLQKKGLSVGGSAGDGFGAFLKKHSLTSHLKRFALAPTHTLIHPGFTAVTHSLRMNRPNIAKDILFDAGLLDSPFSSHPNLPLPPPESLGVDHLEYIQSLEVCDTPKRDVFNRKCPVFTIDDPTTVVVDDGVSVEQCDYGSEWVHIHITDASRYLPIGFFSLDHSPIIN